VRVFFIKPYCQVVEYLQKDAISVDLLHAVRDMLPEHVPTTDMVRWGENLEDPALMPSKTADADSIFMALVASPVLLQRPIFVNPFPNVNQAVIARPPEKLLEITGDC